MQGAARRWRSDLREEDHAETDGEVAELALEVKIEEPIKKGAIGQPFDLEAALIRIWYGQAREKNQSKENQFEEAIQRVIHQVGELPED